MAFVPQTKVFVVKVGGKIFASSDKPVLLSTFPEGEIMDWSFPTLVFPPIPAGEYIEIFPDKISEAYFKHPLSLIPG